jgi:hypothetical protein
MCKGREVSAAQGEEPQIIYGEIGTGRVLVVQHLKPNSSCVRWVPNTLFVLLFALFSSV